jgi:NinB protein
VPHFVLNNPRAIANACKIIQESDPEHPLEVAIFPHSKKRTAEQNALMWVSLLGDFARQGIINGKLYEEDTWHLYLKKLFLPETYIEGKTRKGYKKYVEMPDGELVMKGSTTMLTVSGMTDYLEQCYAFGGQELGIRFTTNKS